MGYWHRMVRMEGGAEVTDQLEMFAPSRVRGVERVIVSTPPPPALTLAEEAEEWMHTPGGRHIMRDLYAIASGYVPRWRRSGIPISVKLVFEIERQRIKEVTARAVRICKARGIEIPRKYGYTLNNSHTAYIARHMMDRRPDWRGLFETREVHAEEKDK